MTIMTRLHCTARLWRDRAGTVAVEFAAILPLLITFFLGAVELTQGVATDRKVTLAVRTVTDLVSQSTAMNNGDMNNILDAGAKILMPYSSSPLRLRVSAVNISSSGVGTVAWSRARNNTARGAGSTVDIPAALAVPNTQLIFGEAEYGYDPTFGYVLTGIINLNEQFYARPRQSGTVEWVN